MEQPKTSFTDLKNDLIGLGDLKVWSVLVTLFGDLAPEETDSIAGPVLSAVMGRMGIRPEALRVAIHRLKKDGWIEASKAGRVSHYALSAHGRRETAAARPTIFGPFPARKSPWFVIIGKDMSTGEVSGDGIPLGRGIFVTQTEPDPDPCVIISKLDGQVWPDWAQDAAMPQSLRDSYARLEEILSRHPLTGPPDALIDSLTLRILILHAWRRLVLRHNSDALDLMGPDWNGAGCRSLVLRSLEILPRHDVSEMQP